MIKLGQRLKEARQQRGLTIEDITKATKIRPAFISSIEKGEYNKLPSSSYAQGFVVNYAEYLGFSKREALALFRREFDESTVFRVLPERFADPAERSFPRVKIQQTVIGIVIAFCLLLGFLGFSYKDALFDPPLTVTQPGEQATVASDIAVKGKTSPYATVTINNAPVALDNKGAFEKKIALFPGKATIIIKAENRFGRQSTVTRIVNVEE